MGLHIFNTLTHQMEEFQPIEPGKVRMYNCGPTVYNNQHIGNFRTFLFADILRRYFEYQGLKVTQIMNITDVGHLTLDDVESGEDKMDVVARELGWDPFKVAEHFTQAFFVDRKVLGFLEPHEFPRATDHVTEMVDYIETLIEKGYAYEVNGNVYFDVMKFKSYGRLSGNTVEQMKPGARIEINPEKNHPADFALWKQDPKHLMQWESPWGKGFPGWHIECSAMSMKYLGETFDIHTGGEDNIFPHHECEIAQSEAATGKPFVKYWIHARHLLWEGRKMSKSAGTFFRPQQLVEKGYSPMAIRLGLASSRYREQVSFSFKLFDDATSSLRRLVEFKKRLIDLSSTEAPTKGEVDSMITMAKEGFESAMDDDLNVSGALSAIHDFARDINREIDEEQVGAEGAKKALEALEKFDLVFGVLEVKEESAPTEVVRLAEKRVEARTQKDFASADAIRDQIKDLGWSVEDAKDGAKFRKL
jgi:cysteinyl-tRNA synthetase